ncbi:MAG: FkbM family methyltransferase [Thiohalobacterales bacterium]|nr:FkbM family methyltransferase [Thiohalobacterales bacterium]
MKSRTGKFFRKTAASLLKRYYISTSGGYSIGSAYGGRFVLDWRHSLDKKVALELYEHDQISYLFSLLDRINARIFLDVGSHAGLYSIITKARYPGMEVHAFEPDRTNLCQLYANLFVNDMQTSVIVHEHGISDHEGRVSFDTSDITSSRGTRRISSTGNIEIEIRRLDSVFDSRDNIIALKIDVEGHECEAVEGANSLLTSNRCLLQVESAPDKLERLRNKLTSLGYKHIGTVGDHYFTNMDFSV